MIRLSLDSINARSFYYVMLSPKGNYIFETERGIHYSISFEEESSFGGCNTYQFIIDKIDKVRSPQNLYEEIAISACRLQEAGVNTFRFLLHQVEHSINLPLGRKHLSTLSYSLTRLNLTSYHG